MYQPVHAIFILPDRPFLVYKLWYFYLAMLHYTNKFIRQWQCMKMYMFEFNFFIQDFTSPVIYRTDTQKAIFVLNGCAFSVFLQSLKKKMGTYLPVSISNGRIPVLNCDIRERRYVTYMFLVHIIISLNIMYVLSLDIFLVLFSI